LSLDALPLDVDGASGDADAGTIELAARVWTTLQLRFDRPSPSSCPHGALDGRIDCRMVDESEMSQQSAWGSKSAWKKEELRVKGFGG
jgi:hypothetical protein